MSTVLRARTPLRVGKLLLPTAASLPHDAWAQRHRGILWLLAAHAVGLAIFGIATGHDWLHAILEGSVVGGIAVVAASKLLPERARSVVASFGLMTASAILVHLSGGYIEAHFHFFVMLGVIFLYEDWLPYMLSVGYVAVHHGVMGTFDPTSVFNHTEGILHPWAFASIHAVFILGLSAALLIAWNVIERARISERDALTQTDQLKRQLQSQEKLAALGSLVSGLAHEVRTPLAVVSNSASILERAARRAPSEPMSGQVLAHVGEIQTGVDRVNALVLQLRRFHALRTDELTLLPLNAVVGDAVRFFRTANPSQRTIAIDLQDAGEVRLHPLGIHQIVINLLGNATDATEAGTGRIAVRTYREGAAAYLEVEDNGVGMDAATAARAFDPLFSTKRDGMGLGLHIVRRIAEAHEGDITLRTAPGQGTTFRARFPIADAPALVAVRVDVGEPASRPAPMV